MEIVNYNNKKITKDLDFDKKGRINEQAKVTKSSENIQLKIDIISDLICPWCFIGKHRLEKAIMMLNNDENKETFKKYDICIRWLPYQLNPQMPKEGIDRRTYRSIKFGSWNVSQELDEQVAKAGLDENIHFAFDKIKRTPNTFNAHRLIWLAQKIGRDQNQQDKIVNTLFNAYFEQGLDIGDRHVLVNISNATGFDFKLVKSFLDSEDGINEVKVEELKAKKMGINAVPCFVINDKFYISGAQEAKVIFSALKDVIAETANTKVSSTSSNSSLPSVCSVEGCQ